MRLDGLEINHDPKHACKCKAHAKKASVHRALAHVAICDGVVEHARSYGPAHRDLERKSARPDTERAL
jgi:hypothetical protein